MKFHPGLLAICCTILSVRTIAQSPHILRTDPAYHTFDRMDVLRMSDTSLVSSINNYNRKEIIRYFQKVWNNDALTPTDRYDLLHAFRDNIEFFPEKSDIGKAENQMQEGLFKNASEENRTSTTEISRADLERSPVLKYFYKSWANFLELETPSFSMYLNPVLHLNYGKECGTDTPVFQNTRGLDLHAYIDKKVYIYLQLLENQRSFLSYQNERIDRFNSLPGQGLYKTFESSVVGRLKGFDYFNAKAYVGFNATRSINVELGHGNHFIGNGFRSLLLSDFSHNYFYLKLNTRIWKFQYQNIFAELAPISVNSIPSDVLLPKKYTATHYLAFLPNPKFEVGLFETVVFGREKFFELQYLNPIILYRAVEHSLGSPDNVMLGLNLKWNFIKSFSVYGQLLLDEFKLSELRSGTGWWANKIAVQAGLKYMNVLSIDHLDMQVEYNTARPYTYTHRDTLSVGTNISVANYSHFSQPLAHPLGANFRETILLLRYRPIPKLQFSGRVLLTEWGDDFPGQNWGGNVLTPHNSREQDYGNFTGQGKKTNITAAYLDIQYEFFHNFFADLNIMRRHTTVEGVSDNRTFVGAGIRVNIGAQNFDY